MADANVGVADRGGPRAGSPRFSRNTQQTGLLGSLETVARQLAARMPLDRIAAVVSDAASKALDAPVLVIAVPDESGRRLHAVHVMGLSRDAGERLPAILREARWAVEAGAGPRLPGAEWLAAVPVPLTGREDGVLLLGRASDRRLTADERAYLRVLTSLLGLALHSMRLEPPARSLLRLGDLEIDLGEQRVVIGDRVARLTPSEIRLLLYLAEEPGRARTRRDILRHLWRTEHVVDERACDVHISNLRRKIERDPSHPQRLVTVRSVGYALQPM